MQNGLRERLKAPDKSVAAGFSLRGKDAPIKGAATGEPVLLGALSLRGKDAPISRVGRDAAVVLGNGAATGAGSML